MSILVITPTVRIPLGSRWRAICRPSEVVISALAGTTQRIIVLGSETYLWAMARVIFSMLSGWSPIAIRVIPGKSIRVRSGQVCEYTYRMIGLSIIFLLAPQTLSVSPTMLSRTSEKLVNFLPLISSGKTAKGVVPSSVWLRRNSRGLLVTTPSPRGKKSRPTIDSRTDDLPADWPPSTAILGKLMYYWRPQSLSSSTTLMNFLSWLYISSGPWFSDYCLAE